MFRIDDATAATTLPVPETAGTPGFFTEGNAAAGTPATNVRASFLNMLQEELMSVLTAGGVTPSKATYNQLLTALRSAGVFQTPAQFDSSTKAATTGFVQRALGNFQAQLTTNSASLVLTAADTGKIICPSAGGFFLSLPAASSVPAGASIRIQPSGNGTLNVGGGGSMIVGAGGSNAVTSLPLNGGDVVCVSDGGTYWFVSGSNTLAYQGGFFASLAANGYQKLPSGLILQWGNVNITSSSAGTFSTTSTLPLAFPNANLAVSASWNGTSPPSSGTASATAPNKSQVQVTIYAPGASTFGLSYLAIGY